MYLRNTVYVLQTQIHKLPHLRHLRKARKCKKKMLAVRKFADLLNLFTDRPPLGNT